MKKFFLAVFLLTPLYSLADNDLFKVSVEDVRFYQIVTPQISITSLKNDIYVEDVIINRGNCKDIRKAPNSIPSVLNFGQSIHVVVLNCNIIEFQIVTKDETFTYTKN